MNIIIQYLFARSHKYFVVENDPIPTSTILFVIVCFFALIIFVNKFQVASMLYIGWLMLKIDLSRFKVINNVQQ